MLFELAKEWCFLPLRGPCSQHLLETTPQLSPSNSWQPPLLPSSSSLLPSFHKLNLRLPLAFSSWQESSPLWAHACVFFCAAADHLSRSNPLQQICGTLPLSVSTLGDLAPRCSSLPKKQIPTAFNFTLITDTQTYRLHQFRKIPTALFVIELFCLFVCLFYYY